MLIEFSPRAIHFRRPIFYRPQFDFSSAYRTWSLITTDPRKQIRRNTRTRAWICIHAYCTSWRNGNGEESNFLKTTWQQIFQRSNGGEWELVFVRIERKPRLVTSYVHARTREYVLRVSPDRILRYLCATTVSPAAFAKFNLPTRETTSIPASPYFFLFSFFFPFFFFFQIDRGIYPIPDMRALVEDCIVRVHARASTRGITPLE